MHAVLFWFERSWFAVLHNTTYMLESCLCLNQTDYVSGLQSNFFPQSSLDQSDCVEMPLYLTNPWINYLSIYTLSLIIVFKRLFVQCSTHMLSIFFHYKIHKWGYKLFYVSASFQLQLELDKLEKICTNSDYYFYAWLSGLIKINRLVLHKYQKVENMEYFSFFCNWHFWHFAMDKATLKRYIAFSRLTGLSNTATGAVLRCFCNSV